MDSHDAPGQAVLARTGSAATEQPARAARHRHIAWIGLGVFLLLIAVAIYRHHATNARRVPFGAMGGPMPVSVARVITADVPVAIDALGTVTPLATVTVRPQVTGPIVRLEFQEGERVRAGQLLAVIDPRPYQAALDQAQGQLARDQAALANARVDLARYKRLLAQDSVSQQTYSGQAATVRQEQAQVEADQAALETARLNLSYCSIRSPVAGRVGLRQVDLGNLVQANQTTPIVTVTQMQPMSVLFTVPESDLTEIFQHTRGQKLVVEAYSRDMQTRLATGTLASIDNQISTTTGTLQMRALFDNAKSELFPDEFVNVKLVLTTLKDQMVVPGGAVQNGPSSNYVYIVNPDDTVSLRDVVTGQTDGNEIAILKGLTAGETVVTDGADQLRNGARVRIPGRKAPQAAGKPDSTRAAGSDKTRCARLAEARRSASGRKARFLERAYQRLGCARGATT